MFVGDLSAVGEPCIRMRRGVGDTVVSQESGRGHRRPNFRARGRSALADGSLGTRENFLER